MIKRTILILLTIVPMACGTKKQPVENRKPVISVSILPQEYFVHQIAGDLFQVNTMIPPGASPATYEPTPSQLAGLNKSALYLEMGYTGFEMSWMEKISAANKKMDIVDLSKGINLIMESREPGETAHGHGGVDPHTWLSPRNARIISDNILTALSSHYPEYTATFKKNHALFNQRIDSLDNYITTHLSGLTHRAFFTYHPSLSYYARDYDLEQFPLELQGKTPSPGHLKNLVDLGKEKAIGVIFLQMQFDQHNAEVLAKEIGAEIVQINPLDPEWYRQMIFITQKLEENLQ